MVTINKTSVAGSGLLTTLLVLSAAALPATGWAQAQATGAPERGILLPADAPSRQAAADPTAGASTGPISYHGGPVILGTTNIYYIWYGNWSGTAGAHSIAVLQNLASNIGGTPYFNINTTYTNGSGGRISNSVRFAGSTTDNYSLGKNLTDSQIQQIVSAAIASGRLPKDTNGLYFVLSSSDVNATSGFCTKYCGWHTAAIIGGTGIRYSFVGNASRCPSACASRNPTISPNADVGADGMASVIAHELEETVTDPDLNAWWGPGNIEENGDKCAWTFGTTYPAINGSLANIRLGGLDYLIQQNWVNIGAGYCAMSYNQAPVLSGIGPNSGKQGTSVPVTLTGSNFVAGATVAVSASGIAVSGVSLVNANTIAATFSLAAGATLGAHSVSVTTAGGTSGTVPFTVTSPTPTLASISPPNGKVGTNVPITLTGTNFIAGASVAVGASGVTVSGVSVVNATTISATFSIAAGATLGAHSVSVTTAGGTSGTVGFTVTAPAPTLTSISPTSGKQGVNVPVTLTGTNFIAGAAVAVGGSGVTVSGVSVVNATTISATLTIGAGATIGARTVSVATSGGTSGTVNFTVTVGTPVLIGITPVSGRQGTNVPVTLTGSNFVAGATVAISASGITVSGVSVVDSTTISATFSVAAGATLGIHTVSVSTSGGSSGTVNFNVIPPAPILTAISPVAANGALT